MNRHSKLIYKNDLAKANRLLNFSKNEIKLNSNFLIARYVSLKQNHIEVIVPLIDSFWYQLENSKALCDLIKDIEPSIKKLSDEIIIVINDIDNTQFYKECLYNHVTLKILFRDYKEIVSRLIHIDKFLNHYKLNLNSLVNEDEQIFPIRSKKYEKFHQTQINDTLLAIKQDIIEDVKVFQKKSSFLGILGSYGSGKSLILNEIAIKLIEDTDLNILPILVDLRSFSSLTNSINVFINQIYDVFLENSFQDFYKCFNEDTQLIFLLDSFDEQRHLNDEIIDLFFINYLNSFIREYNAKIIFASRQEVFSDWNNTLIKSNKIRVSKKNVFFLESIHYDQNIFMNTILNKIPEGVIKSDDFLTSFLEKPLWYKYSVDFFDHENVNALWLSNLVEFCITEWQKRENKTERHPMVISLRIKLNKLAALRIFSDKKHSIRRHDFVSFIRQVIIDNNTTNDNLLGMPNIIEALPPEATAQSLIVSNLITVDQKNNINYHDKNIFYLYYLSLVIKDILINESISDIESEILKEYFNINDNIELLSSNLLPDVALFYELLRNELVNFDLEEESNKFVDCFKINKAQEIDYFSLKQILVDFNEFDIEEKRIYELKPPNFWPLHTNYYFSKNIFKLLDYFTDQSVFRLNSEFCKFQQDEFNKTIFQDCDFSGAHFIYCKFNQVQFISCEMDYCLFEHCEFDEITLNSLEKQNSCFFIGLDKFQKKTDELLKGLKSDDEEWIQSNETIRIKENKFVPVKLPLFLTKKGPVTNKSIIKFIEKHKSFGYQKFRQVTENKYYLQYVKSFQVMNSLSEEKKDVDFLNLPVTYISLLTAFAYCLQNGSRLPNAAEMYLIKEKSNPENEKGIDEYWKLPPVKTKPNKDHDHEIEFYPGDLLVEMTYQIDNLEYWGNLKKERSEYIVNPISSFDRNVKMRCEYIIYGDQSFYDYQNNSLQKYKMSKIATWLNPDQTFREVFDYSTIIFKRIYNGEYKRNENK